MTEKYYGRVARTIVVKPAGGEKSGFPMLEEALAEARILDPEDPLPMLTYRKVRVSQDRAVEFAARLVDLAEEFAAAPRGGEVVYGLIAGVFPTDRPTLAQGEEA